MRPSRLSAVAVVCAFGLIVALVATCGRQPANVGLDQNQFHLRAIQQFVAEWPRFNLRNYSSATSPGYHLALAAVSRYVSDDLRIMRLIGGLFGFALIAALAWAATKRSACAGWLTLIVACSYYVLNSTVWLLPDDAAWLLVTVGLILAMWADGWRLFAGSAVTLALLVFVRQPHAWALLPLAAASYSLSRYAGGGLGRVSAALPVDLTSADPFSNPPRAYRKRGPDALLLGVLAMLPAIAVLIWLVWLWHGLTPPAFQPGSGIDLPMATKVGGLAPAAPAMVLALLGLFGTPLLGWLWPAMPTKRVVRLLMIGAIVGMVFGVLPNTTYEPLTRRSGLWNIVQKLPTISRWSPLMVVLSTFGGAVAMVALARLPQRERFVLASALIGFTLAQIANVLVWQRYYEPFVLIWLVLAGATPADDKPNGRCWRIAGVVAVTAFQIAVTIYGLRGV